MLFQLAPLQNSGANIRGFVVLLFRGACNHLMEVRKSSGGFSRAALNDLSEASFQPREAREQHTPKPRQPPLSQRNVNSYPHR